MTLSWWWEERGIRMTGPQDFAQIGEQTLCKKETSVASDMREY